MKQRSQIRVSNTDCIKEITWQLYSSGSIKSVWKMRRFNEHCILFCECKIPYILYFIEIKQLCVCKLLEIS